MRLRHDQIIRALEEAGYIEVPCPDGLDCICPECQRFDTFVEDERRAERLRWEQWKAGRDSRRETA